MKMSYEKKQKLAGMRKERIRKYVKWHGVGESIFLKNDEREANPKSYYILASHELLGNFYYVLGANDGSIIIGKVVYSGDVGVIKVAEHTKKYMTNKELFDSWINEAKEKREADIRMCYNSFSWRHKGEIVPHTLIVDYNVREIGAKLSLTKEYNGKYYFVVKLSNKNYLVTKLGWKNRIIMPIAVTEEEFKANKEVFEDWISEANRNDEAGEKHE